MLETTGVLVMGQVTVHDEALWARYRQQVPATLAPWQGRVLARGTLGPALCGQPQGEQGVILHFPSQAHAEGWYGSPAYQALLPLRQAAADMSLMLMHSNT
ncbi:DUF1330 domain-containing protein [Leeia aquatica]|uniref:DUF1330 domain-containing protein n=1 Tax=Leeia aquatica TaxID=2725557 RepID=A0A847SGP2_9NEIS|nr:DUF1330 domain-containing protein [Leeia aquatica]NLR75102.1 DUF1330 domain-containing protein [Leeia aquatica]